MSKFKINIITIAAVSTMMASSLVLADSIQPSANNINPTSNTLQPSTNNVALPGKGLMYPRSSDLKNPPQIRGSSLIVQAINQLGNRLEALSVAGQKSANSATHQTDPNLPSLKFVNSQKNKVSDAVKNEVSDQTSDNIKNTLQQIPNSALTYNIKTPDVEQVSKEIQARHNLLNLLANTPASDTLYSDVMGIDASPYYTNGTKLSKPAHLYNNYFNFGSLFSPKAYNPSQQIAANYYLDYLTNRYQSLTSGIDFDKLKSNLNKYKNNPNKLANKLSNFMNSDAYRNYEMTIRSITASKSIALNNLNKLMLERTPIETQKPNPTLEKLSKAIGVKPTQEKITDPNNPSKKIKVYAYASPMQISNYMANHRVQSNDWYQRMATASPATVQRETLYVLAEIESQMQQAHIDRERMLATMTALQLESDSVNQMLLKTQTQAVNTAIDALNDDNSDSQSQQMSQNNNTPKFNATGADYDQNHQQKEKGKHHKKK